ncbi:MAG: DUF465 domain-containing protein [Pseudomonadota bacterium]
MAGYPPPPVSAQSFRRQRGCFSRRANPGMFYNKHQVTTGIPLPPWPGTETCRAPSFFQKNGNILFLPSEWRGLPMQTDIDSLKQRINQLHLEHRDLDDVITRLAEKPGQDQLQLQRLKKKKLLLKDQISHLERQLTPDIRA